MANQGYKKFQGFFHVHIVKDRVIVFVTLTANSSLSCFSGYFIKNMWAHLFINPCSAIKAVLQFLSDLVGGDGNIFLKSYLVINCMLIIFFFFFLFGHVERPLTFLLGFSHSY